MNERFTCTECSKVAVGRKEPPAGWRKLTSSAGVRRFCSIDCEGKWFKVTRRTAEKRAP